MVPEPPLATSHPPSHSSTSYGSVSPVTKCRTKEPSVTQNTLTRPVPLSATASHPIACKPQAQGATQLSVGAAWGPEATRHYAYRCPPGPAALEQVHRVVAAANTIPRADGRQGALAATPLGPAMVPGAATYPKWTRATTSMTCTAS
jgi:hypothetical protein